MEPTSIIRIPNPSATMVAILKNAHQQKRERMKQMRERLKDIK